MKIEKNKEKVVFFIKEKEEEEVVKKFGEETKLILVVGTRIEADIHLYEEISAALSKGVTKIVVPRNERLFGENGELRISTITKMIEEGISPQQAENITDPFWKRSRYYGF